MEANVLPKSEFELVKSTGAIQMANDLSLVERKANNILHLHAQDKIGEQESHEYPLTRFKEELNYNSNNNQHLFDTIDKLVGTKARLNILGTDNKIEAMAVTTLLADAIIIDSGPEKVIRYSYSPLIRKLYSSPGIYAKLNIHTQKQITKKPTLALWEFLIDFSGRAENKRFATDWITLEKCKSILAGGEDKYSEFKHFNNRMIKPAIKELQNLPEFEEISVDYKREGRAVKYVRFFVIKADEVIEDTIELTSVEEPTFDEETYQLLLNKKISISRSKQMVNQFSKEHIEANLKYVEEHYNEEKRQPPLFVQAIKENYANYLVQNEEKILPKIEIQQFPKNEMWEAVVEKMKNTMTQDEYKSWFSHLQCESIDGDKVTLHAANKYIRQYALKKYVEKIQHTFRLIHSKDIVLEINTPEIEV